jgi:hypothetical protein
MAQGLPGADSSLPVTSELINAAASLLGATPIFWGRYFTRVSTSGSVEYRHATENQPLNQAGIRLLPIARQTPRVNGSMDQGIADGAANAQDFIKTFSPEVLASQGGQFLMFLDVEASLSLSADYFTGWTRGLAQEATAASGGSVRLLPCIYGSQGDVDTWPALAAAIASGAECHGAWIAHYYRPGKCTMGDWDPTFVTPSTTGPFPCPILAWQYAGNCLTSAGEIDCSQINPNIDVEAQLLSFLALPPGAMTVLTT